ncbi:hypothetical protein [Pseudomonas sp. CGJS7]|uniref:hypothetical protein n=1 Tax=Pseudomonas sp. CGJS7 TaxID=3109348 RepID=UPI00300A8C6F
MTEGAPFGDVQVKASSTAPLGRMSAPPRTVGQRIAREVGGLGLRNVVEGAADLAGVLYDPITDGVNWLGEREAATGQPDRWFPRQYRAREISGMALDALGVPKPETASERVYGDIGRSLT